MGCGGSKDLPVSEPVREVGHEAAVSKDGTASPTEVKPIAVRNGERGAAHDHDDKGGDGGRVRG